MKLTQGFFSAVLLIYLASACATRAPSEYELDRRAGLVPAIEVERLSREAADLQKVPGSAKFPQVPPRTKPRLERVWVYDQELDGGYWLQGTYIYFELEPGRWQVDAAADAGESL